MAQLDISQATTTDFSNQVPDFIVDQIALDAAEITKDESYWYFSNAQKYFGYYLTIPEIFSAANALSTWTVNRGWVVSDPLLKAQLEHVKGMGKDTFTQIMWNHEVVKLIVGDAFI